MRAEIYFRCGIFFFSDANVADVLTVLDTCNSLRFSYVFFKLYFFEDTKSSCWSRYQQNVRSSPAGSHIPWCKADGSFIPFQVQASQFFCVNRRGEELPGMSVDISLGKPDCQAASECF